MFQNRFLFRFRFPCRRAATLWTKKACDLDETFSIPFLGDLDRSSGDRKAKPSAPFDLRMGWNEDGLAFSLHVFGKQQTPWCRTHHPEESDGLQICLDTRNVKDVHRATRFCHRLVFLPIGAGTGQTQPSILWLPIHRAKGHPNPIDLSQIKAATVLTKDGYQMDVTIPGRVLTGYDPEEHPELGFHYVLVDRELGEFYFYVQPPFPHDQDPSLWGTLELVRD